MPTFDVDAMEDLNTEIHQQAHEWKTPHRVGYGVERPEYAVILNTPDAVDSVSTGNEGFHRRVLVDLMRLAGLRVDGPDGNAWITYLFKCRKTVHSKPEMSIQFDWLAREMHVLGSPRVLICVGQSAFTRVGRLKLGADRVLGLSAIPFYTSDNQIMKDIEEQWLLLGRKLRQL